MIGEATRWAIAGLAVMTALGLTGCVHVGYGDPNAEHAYVAAMRPAAESLTAAAGAANDSCAGGSHPDQATCYANTQKEITAVRALQAALRNTKTPARFVKANTDLLHGLDVMAQGLTERNQGLAARSSAEYKAGVDLVSTSLNMQKHAFSEFPSNSGITA